MCEGLVGPSQFHDVWAGFGVARYLVGTQMYMRISLAPVPQKGSKLGFKLMWAGFLSPMLTGRDYFSRPGCLSDVEDLDGPS